MPVEHDGDTLAATDESVARGDAGVEAGADGESDGDSQAGALALGELGTAGGVVGGGVTCAADVVAVTGGVGEGRWDFLGAGLGDGVEAVGAGEVGVTGEMLALCEAAAADAEF